MFYLLLQQLTIDHNALYYIILLYYNSVNACANAKLNSSKYLRINVSNVNGIIHSNDILWSSPSHTPKHT